MKRYFNTEGQCEPDIHYMVQMNQRMGQIKERYVDRGCYFAINRGRQYGKTTTLRALENYLKPDYLIVSVDFQEIGTEEFESADAFSRAFIKIFCNAFPKSGAGDYRNLLDPLVGYMDEERKISLREMFEQFSRICGMAGRPLVVMIDEVDSASNNQVFLDFLALLRKYYMNRRNVPAFHSVILAGVYDVKNLKLKIRPDKEHKYNSPWNIATDFNIRMSFSVGQIASMLEEYEADCHTGMNVDEMAEDIYAYTSGYPYFVSAICKRLDEDVPDLEVFEDGEEVWNKKGIEAAVKIILETKEPLFESMARQIDEHSEIKRMLEVILFQGAAISYNVDNPVINLASMFGYIKNNKGSIQVANRIFETRLYNLFLSEEELTNVLYNKAQGNRFQFVRNGKLDMDFVFEKFAEYFTDIYRASDEKFIEEQGRKLFLLYLKPIINGVGNYYIEARTRDARRTDVIVDYGGELFIVEIKIWHGMEYNERGEKQLAEYLESYHQKKGYLLSFNFNKKKEVGMNEIKIKDKTIVEVVV